VKKIPAIRERSYEVVAVPTARRPRCQQGGECAKAFFVVVGVRGARRVKVRIVVVVPWRTVSTVDCTRNLCQVTNLL